MICYYILKDGTLRRVDAVPKKFRTLNYFIRRSFFDDNYIITALGQDSGDTLLNKGIFIGGGRLNMKFGYLVVEQ